MNSADAIRKVLEATGKSAYRVSLDLGMMNNYIGTIFSRDRDVTGAKLAQIIGTCGYSLVCVPRETVSDLDPETCFVIDGSSVSTCQKCGKQIDRSDSDSTTIGIGGKSAKLCGDCAREIMDTIA